MTNVPATYNAFPCNFARLSTDLSRQERRVIRRKHEREKYGLVANLNGCRHPIVRKIVEESGFKIDDGEDTKSAYLIWSDCFIAFERLLTLRPYQRVNHFPGMIEICRKDFLAKNYSRQAKMDPGEYDFFPRTWVLPHEYGTFLAYAKRNPHAAYILKPANGAMGHGIRIFTNVDSVPANLGSNGTYVLQEYITNPLLIDGYKFDLRVYVLITSCCPLRIFVYNEGLVRVSAEKYISPIEPNGESMYRHLTNYTLNKRHHHYIRCDDESTGSKRSFAFLDNYIQENLQSDPQIIWRRIRNLIVKTMIIGAPHINHAYRLFHRGSGRPTSLSYLSCDTVRTAKGCSRTSSCSQASDRKAWNMAPQRTVKNGSNSGSTGRAASAAATIASDRASIAIRSAAFEILGFDIMLDRNLRPWLIEVNRSPSFGCDQELDVRVKSGLLRDALHLINIRPSDKQMAEEAMKMRSIRRLLSASPSQVLLSSVSQDSIPLHHISPKLVSSASNKAKNEPYIKHGSPNSQDLAADWLQKPSELYRRIRELRERLFEMQRESELECFENANCGNWRRAYPTSDRVLEQRYARLLTNAFLDFNKGSEGDLLHVIQLSQPGGQQEDELRRHLEFMEREASKLQSNALQKPRKPASKPRRCPATSSKRSSRSHFSSEKCTSGECGEREDFVDVEGGEDDSEALGARSLTTYGPEAYGETSDSSEDASWSPRNYFGYRGHLGIEFFTDNAMTATCAYHRNPLGINALQKRTMTLGRNTIRF